MKANRYSDQMLDYAEELRGLMLRMALTAETHRDNALKDQVQLLKSTMWDLHSHTHPDPIGWTDEAPGYWNSSTADYIEGQVRDGKPVCETVRLHNKWILITDIQTNSDGHFSVKVDGTICWDERKGYADQ